MVLASASPRRAKLLDAAGVHVLVRPPNIDETPHPREDAIEHARRLAQHKLETVLDPDREPVPHIAADTVVWLPTAAPRSASRGTKRTRAASSAASPRARRTG